MVSGVLRWFGNKGNRNMSAYLNVSVVIKDMEKLQEYVGLVRPIIASHGGAPMLRGMRAETLNGTADFNMHAVFKFPDADAVRAFWNSDEYAKIVPVRNQGAEMTVTLLEDF
jgi:uncharacterized protein (DUF1330 family)